MIINDDFFQIGINVGTIVTERRLKVAPLAKKVGCHRDFLYDVMKGKNCNLDLLHALAREFGMSFDELAIYDKLKAMPPAEARQIRAALFGATPAQKFTISAYDSIGQ